MLTQVGLSMEYVAYIGLCNNFIFYNATLFQVGAVNESRNIQVDFLGRVINTKRVNYRS